MASALRRVSSSPRRTAPFRGVPLAPRQRLLPGLSPFQKRVVASVSTPGVGHCPAAVPRPEGRFWLRGRCPTGDFPAAVRFPSEEGRLRDICSAPGWSLPGCFPVSLRGGALSGRWLASVAAARLPSGFPPRRGAFVTAGVAAGGCCPAAFRFPTEVGRLSAAGWPPGARGVGARAVTARPRGGGWLGPGRCFAVRRPPRRGWPLGPACRPSPKRRLACRPVVAGLRGGRFCRNAVPRSGHCRPAEAEHCRPRCVVGVARLPRKVGTRLVGGLSRCAPSAPSRSPSLWLRSRAAGASPFG